MQYTAFTVRIEEKVAHVAFDIAGKANALNDKAWAEMKSIFEELDRDAAVRVVVLSGNGKHFCAGIDLEALMNQSYLTIDCEGRKREAFREYVLHLQSCITTIELCRKPVIAAVHGGCIGGGLDIATACDMRYSVDDAYFTIRETDLGIVADLGTLQRLPKLIAPGLAAEMAYTGRKVYGPEAKQIGLVNESFTTQEELMTAVHILAITIATKSPLVTRGIKEVLLHSRDHTVADGLQYVATYNSGVLLSNDLAEAVEAQLTKRPAKYED